VSTLTQGALLHDRYRILRPIGKGGMGAVYEAIDTRLRNTVAVKQLSIQRPEADRAFEREAQLLAGLRHPVLPVVIDYFTDGANRYLVMQYIEGEDFAQYLARQRRPCTEEEVVAVAKAVLDALEYLHSHTPPIIHRDIKPSNLKRTPSGEVVLLDFGLAKGRLDSDPTETPDDRSLYGFTVQYAPPEQINGRGTDARSDLFALAATLYHLGTGTLAATALERGVIVANGGRDPLVTAHAANAALSTRLSRTLSAALQLEPADRFASAAQMRSALSELWKSAPRAAEPKTVERRVDAALPSQVEVGRQTDLLVQVRFADSPFLGLEDWPKARRPEQIEQRSEPLQVTHPVDQATGRLAPARVRIKLAASDFTVEGDAERLIEVPVDDYSKRIAFLLTPRRAGVCRVNVEVYALDALYLGAVPVEAEAVGVEVPEPVLQVANLILGAFARQAAEAPHTAAIPVEPSPTAMVIAPTGIDRPPSDTRSTADTVKIRLQRPPGLSAPAPPPLDEPLSQVAMPPPKAARSLSARLSVVGGAVAAVLIAGVVFISWPFGARRVDDTAALFPGVTSSPPPAAASPPPAAPEPSSPSAAAPPTSNAASPRAGRPPQEEPSPAPRTNPPAVVAAPPAPEPPTAAPAPPRPSAAPNTEAARAMDAGEKLEKSGDLADALKQFERARQLDTSRANVADRAIARVRERMTREGTAALRTARQYDALGRNDDAMTWYERAVKLLPDEDPNKKIAKERLDALRLQK